MFISMRGRNVLKLMADLASQDSNHLSKAKEISQRLGLSDRYLEESLAVMKTNGFVKSIRGAKGGYQLKKPADEYTIREILEAAEGSLSPVQCIDDPDYCLRQGECITMGLWLRMHETMQDLLDNTTLQDLLDWNSSRRENKGADTETE